MTARPAGRRLADPLENPRADRVRRIASLAGRSARERAGLVLVEGPQAVRELVAHRAASVEDVYVDTSVGTLAVIAEAALDAGLYVHEVTAEVAQAMSASSQGIVAVAKPDAVVDGPIPAGATLVAILADVRDPGNAGTAIRVADAAGADAVILAGDCVDVLGPKVVRASVGSVFHLPVLRRRDIAAAIAEAKGARLTVIAADVDGTSELFAPGAPDVTAPIAWLFGNEAHGLGVEELAAADEVVRIPMLGAAESLNLGTAVAVCLYGRLAAGARPHPGGPHANGGAELV